MHCPYRIICHKADTSINRHHFGRECSPESASIVGICVTPTIPSPAPPRALFWLAASPDDDPIPWAEATTGDGAPGLAVINPPVEAGTGSAVPWASMTSDIERLAAAGVEPLGHVSIGYGTRPLVDLLGEITRWAVYAVVGIFLDHAPAGPFQVGPVALAARMVRRAGLARLVLNPGVPVDPMYRALDVTICTFDGPWSEYRAWSGEDTMPGDGHLVYGVPQAERADAWALIAARGAGLGLVTDRSGFHSTAAAIPRPAGAGSGRMGRTANRGRAGARAVPGPASGERTAASGERTAARAR